jgi:primase-polymerase (primpol)-like protein
LQGQRASSKDPATWCSFSDAIAAYEQRPDLWSGIGFVFTDDDPFCGIDLDDVIDPELESFLPWSDAIRQKFAGDPPEPEAIVQNLATYTEVSPSGTGVKVFAVGRIPPDGNRRNTSGQGIEMYESGRYFTITGNRVPGTPLAVEHRSDQIATLHGQMFGRAGGTRSPPARKQRPTDWSPGPVASITAEDQALVNRIFTSKAGPKFWRLWRGNTEGHDTDSEADLALASILAFWVGPDIERIERLMRRSKLYRPKWDHHPTYLRRTINKVLKNSNYRRTSP